MEPTTRTQPGWAIVLVASLCVIAGCSDKKTPESVSQTSAAPQAQPAKPAPQATPAATPEAAPTPAPEARAKPGQPPTTRPAPASPPVAPQRGTKEPAPVTPPPSAVPEPSKPEPARSQEAKPAQPTQGTPEKPVATESRKVAPKDVVVLTGAPLGGVRLEHKLHTERAGNTCTTCHHASRPEKPATAPQQACSECHTKVAAAPMKTKYQGAFHNPTAQSGTCVDCHKAENAKGKKAPLKCTECHKKENS